LPDSSRTKQLLSLALSSGDAYYRRAMETLLQGVIYDDQCRDLGTHYLEHLQLLRNHLSSLKDDEKVRELRHSTDSYIELIRKDLDLKMSPGKQFCKK
jgi:hypothetical protein